MGQEKKKNKPCHAEDAEKEDMSETLNRIRFTKMSGSGNDFIIIDNRELKLEKERGRELARLACRRKVSVGADGLILIENDARLISGGSFSMQTGAKRRCAATGRAARPGSHC